MAYTSKKERIKKVIDDKLLKHLSKIDLDYYKVRTAIATDLGVSLNDVSEMIDNYISAGKIKEHRIITIPDESVQDWLKDERQFEKEKAELDKVLEVNQNGRN